MIGTVQVDYLICYLDRPKRNPLGIRKDKFDLGTFLFRENMDMID